MQAPEALFARAQQHFKQGELQAAVDLLTPLRQRFPHKPEILLLLANIQIQAGELSQAREQLAALIQQPQAPAESFFLFSRLCQQEKNRAEAEQLLQRAVQLYPNLAKAWYELGRLQIAQVQAEQALKSLHKAQQLSPRTVPILSVMGRAHHDLFQLHEAAACYQEALEIAPQHAGLWSDLGNIWRILEELDKAESCYQQALKLEPAHPSSTLNQKLLQLIRNQPEGWSFVTQLRLNKPAKYALPGAQYWDGVVRPSTPLAIIEEYGRGDLIQMLRFIPRLIAAGQPCLLYARHTGWPRLLANMGVDIPCYEAELWQTKAFAPYFFYDSDLAAYFECLPHGDRSQPYVFATESLLPPAQRPRRPRIALVWASGQFTSNRRNDWSYQQRSLHLQELEPLIHAFPDSDFYSLQMGADALQLQELDLPVSDLQGLIHDFYDTACLLQDMDLLITVDTAIAHLAGALGRPTYLLLSQGPDWRWGLNAKTSDWYPSVTLLRQHTQRDWQPVIQEVIRHLGYFFLRKD